MRLGSFQTMLDWLTFILKPRNLAPPQCSLWHEFILFATVVIDSIWSTRNSIVHQQAILNLSDLQSSIFLPFSDHLLWSERFSSSPCGWKAPGA